MSNLNHKEPSDRDKLLVLAHERIFLLSHTPAKQAHVSICEDAGHFEVLRVKSDLFKSWLRGVFHHEEGKAVNATALDEVVATIESDCIFRGEARPVFTRVAEWRGDIFLDLADTERRVVRVTKYGWNVEECLDEPLFFRPESMAPLPAPARGGTIEELRQFVNIPNHDDWVLFVSWLVAPLRPHGPYPILGLFGVHGSAKTTTGEVGLRLVDPSSSGLRTSPRTERDLVIAASRSHVAAFDNLSYISPWFSDALCRLATGGGLRVRKLYSDDDEKTFHVECPVLLTGIEDVASRPDLLDRLVLLHLPTIPETERRTKQEFWERFEKARPRILGSLLDAVSAAQRNVPGVHLKKLPRMADFATWATAAEAAFEFRKGDFMRAYMRNRSEASAIALEASPIAFELERFMKDKEPWTGTAKQLLEDLERANSALKKSHAWPHTPKALAGAIQRLEPVLRGRLGIAYTRLNRESGTGQRLFKLERIKVEAAETAA